MKKITFFLLLIINFCQTIYGQNTVSYSVENTNHGLGSNSVNCIEIDSKGIVWVGTIKGGVSRFDGFNWINYTKENTNNGLVSNVIYCISFDKNGNTWFGTDEGVSKFDGTTWENYTKENTNNGLAGNKIMTIAIDRKGWQWFGVLSKGVSVYNGKEWLNFNYYNSPAIYVFSMIVDSLGDVWCGSLDNLLKYDGKNWYHIKLPFSGAIATKIALDKKGDFWCAINKRQDTGIGLINIKNDTFKVYNKKNTNKIIKGPVYTIAFDSSNNVWIGENYRVCKFDGKEWKKYLNIKNRPSLTEGIHTISIAIDSQNNKWIGTYEGVLVIKE